MWQVRLGIIALSLASWGQRAAADVGQRSVLRRDPLYVESVLRDWAKRHSDLVRYLKLGHSQRGYPISCVSISTARRGTVPKIYLNAAHHGDEPLSVGSVLSLVNHLIAHRNNPNIRAILRRAEIVVQPMVNPDGYAINSRFDIRGRDPNRDYASEQRTDDSTFQLPETRIVSQLMRRSNFYAATAIHTGLESVLWPNGYSPEPPAQESRLRTLAHAAASAMRISSFQQSFYDYPTEGEFIDYAAMKGVLALTMEISAENEPPSHAIPALLQRAVHGLKAFISTALKMHREQSHSDHPYPAPLVSKLVRFPAVEQ